MTREEAIKLTDNEINNRIGELSRLLDMGTDWDKNYDEYCLLNSISDERYRNKYMKQFEDFFYKNIYGKEWNEIDGDILDTYSDWHKDMFGYRPRSTDKDW